MNEAVLTIRAPAPNAGSNYYELKMTLVYADPSAPVRFYEYLAGQGVPVMLEMPSDERVIYRANMTGPVE